MLRRGRQRNRTWLLTEVDGGQVDLTCNGRAVLRAVAPETARRKVRGQRRNTDRVYIVGPDGYRTEITRSLG